MPATFSGLPQLVLLNLLSLGSGTGRFPPIIEQVLAQFSNLLEVAKHEGNRVSSVCIIWE